MVKVTLPFVRETKNTVVYQVDREKAKEQKLATDTLYVQKSALPSPPPKAIILTIEFATA